MNSGKMSDMELFISVQKHTVFGGDKPKLTQKRARYILTRDCVNLLGRRYLPVRLTLSLCDKSTHSQDIGSVQKPLLLLSFFAFIFLTEWNK